MKNKKKKAFYIIIPIGFIVFLYKSIFPINLKMYTNNIECEGIYYTSKVITHTPAKKVGITSDIFTGGAIFLLDEPETKIDYNCFVKYEINDKNLEAIINSEDFYNNHKLGDHIPCEYTKITYFNTITQKYKYKYKDFKVKEYTIMGE